MAETLTRAQIRSARVMLGWSIVDLAKAARVSVSSIKRAEDDRQELVSDTIAAAIRDALETEGVRFLTDDGNGRGLRLKDRGRLRAPSARTEHSRDEHLTTLERASPIRDLRGSRLVARSV